MVEFPALGTEAGFDVAQTGPVGELGEGHAPELIGTGERLDVAISVVSRDTVAEHVPWKVFHDLSENQAAGVHCILPLDGAGQ